MSQVYGFGRSDAGRVAESTRRVENTPRRAMGKLSKYDVDNWTRPASINDVRGYLTADLPAATSNGAAPGTSTLEVWEVSSDGTWQSTGQFKTVINRDTTVTFLTGTYCLIEKFQNEWVVYYAACAPVP